MIKLITYTTAILLVLTFNTALKAQISGPGSGSTQSTNYPVFRPNDNIFVFCTPNETSVIATLRVQTQLSGTKTFLWEKFNAGTGLFEFYSSESSESSFSQITTLKDGCYRATVTLGATTETYRAWVFNTRIKPEGSVAESNCKFFTLTGSYTASEIVYYDLTSKAEVKMNRDLKVQWLENQKLVASVAATQVFNPPTKNTDYTFRVYDKFGCEQRLKVTYNSIVTKAYFTVDPAKGEAPLDVTFKNESENGDPGLYEWFFFRDLTEIKKESENTQEPVDSIMLVAYDDKPVYTYENTGDYMVKLVSKKVSELHTCVDTFYLKEYIKVDTSFVKVPNVFTPNGDGTNDQFVIKFWSMKDIRISIFNRWGKRIHYWENNDIRGFKNTYAESVWDGKLGGRYASPGVYFYVVEGTGRDGTKRKAGGFFHLFREK